VSNADRCSQLRNKLHHPLREVAEIRQQIRPEAFKCDLSGRQNQHDAEQQQIHQVDDDERKKRALIGKIGLVLGNHPAGEREMERPRDANHGVKQPPIRLHVYEKAKSAVNSDRENAVYRKEIRRQCDPEIRLGGHYVPAVETNSEPAYAATHQPHPDGVR